MLSLGAWLIAGAAAQAQLSVSSMEAAGARIEGGDEGGGCDALAAVVAVAYMDPPARRELLHRHAGFARWTRRCVDLWLRHAARTRSKERQWATLMALRASPLLVDRVQERRVDRATAVASRRLGGRVPPTATVPPVHAEGVRAAFRQAAPRMLQCVQRALVPGLPPPGGTLHIHIRGDGVVRRVRLDSRGPPNVGFERCLRNVLTPVRFPASRGRGMSIAYPLFVDTT